MKKLLFGCLGLIVVLILVAVGAVMMLDSHVEVERSKQISASPEEIYAIAADLHTWPEWSYWNKERDPECTWEFTGESKGDGDVMSWSGTAHGKGRLTLNGCVEGQKLAYDLAFLEGEEEMETTGFLELTPSGEGTTVRWVMVAELEGVGKLFGLFMDGMVGEMFEVGLDGLEAKVGG